MLSRIQFAAFVIVRLIRSSTLCVRTCVRACVRSYVCTRASEWSSASDSYACAMRASVYSESIGIARLSSRVAKLVMYLTWDNRRRQVSRTPLSTPTIADSRCDRRWQPGKKMRKAAWRTCNTHTHAHADRRLSHLLCLQPER